MNKERLLELADILDAVPDGHYDQTTWINDCGTTACAMGWWTIKHPERWTFQLSHISGFCPKLKNAPNLSVWDSIKREFGIDDCAAEELFCDAGCNRAKTGKQAAAYIRDFVARDGQ